MSAILIAIALILMHNSNCYIQKKSDFKRHPALIIKTAHYVGSSFFGHLLKNAIQYYVTRNYVRNFQLHAGPLSIASYQLCDVGFEAIYTAFSRGPDKIPHGLLQYAGADYLCTLINKAPLSSALSSHFIKESYALRLVMWMVQPIIIRAAVRTTLDIIVDQLLQEECEQIEE